MFNEYGDSIFAQPNFLRKAEKAKSDQEIEKQRLLDTIENLRHVIARMNKKRPAPGSDEFSYQSYEQKCKELRKNNYDLVKTVEKQSAKIKNLESTIEHYEKKLKILQEQVQHCFRNHANI